MNYRELNNLYQSQPQFSPIIYYIVLFSVEGGPLHGLYIKAVCEGLDNVLDPYRQTVLDLEKQILADPHLTAAHLQTALEQVNKYWLILISRPLTYRPLSNR